MDSLTPDHSVAPDHAFVLAMALGDVSTSFRTQLEERLPHAFPDYATVTLRSLGDVTDALLPYLDAEDPPGTTLLITSQLAGTVSPAELLVRFHQRFPRLHLALIVSELTPETRQLIATCAAFQMYNVLVGDEFTLSQIVQLVTTPFTWEHVQPYLSVTTKITLPSSSDRPADASSASQAVESADRKPVPSFTVAVVSGKGGVGKTGIIANLIAASPQISTMAIDMDYIKPSLPLYFHEANDAPAVDLRRLLTQIAARHSSRSRRSMAPLDDLSPEDLADIRQYVAQSEPITAAARIVPGASRFETVMPVPPPVVMSTLLSTCQSQARVVWVDTPGVPTDPVWITMVSAADFVVMVSTPEYAVLLETIDLLRKLDRLQIPRSQRGLILNKRSKWGYSTHAITTTHLPGLPLLGEIPYDPARWERSLQHHRPLALDHPKPWQTLFHTITHVDLPQPRRSWWPFPWKGRSA